MSLSSCTFCLFQTKSTKHVTPFCNWLRQWWSRKFRSPISHRIKRRAWAIVVRLPQCCPVSRRVHSHQASRIISVCTRTFHHLPRTNRNSIHRHRRPIINSINRRICHWIYHVWPHCIFRHRIWIVSNRNLTIQSTRISWHRIRCWHFHCRQRRRPHRSHVVHRCHRSKVYRVPIRVVTRVSAAVPRRWNKCTHRTMYRRMFNSMAMAMVAAVISHRRTINRSMHADWAIVMRHPISHRSTTVNVVRRRRLTD